MNDRQNIPADLHSLGSVPMHVDSHTVRGWYQLMHRGRTLDEKAARYLNTSKGWFHHAPCAGHEGIQLAMGLSVRRGKDFLFPWYRDLMTVLAAGMTVEEIVLNGLSKATDTASGGRHMSNHFAKPAMRIQHVSSRTCGHSLHAVGVARAIRRFDGDELSFYSSGGAATSEGNFYEALSGACREALPVVFVLQNNGYDISYPVHEQHGNNNIANDFHGFRNLLVLHCDGTDIFDSWNAMNEACAYAREEKGPVMVHADCVRIGAHSNPDRHELYRNEVELNEALRRDPLLRLRALLLAEGISGEDELVELEMENKRLIEEESRRAETAAEPDPGTVTRFVYADDTHVCPLSNEDFSRAMTTHAAEDDTVSLHDAINRVLHEEFRRNPSTFLWGQDVASGEGGGVFNVTNGMLQEFGNDRVFDAPEAMDFLLGTANGFCRYSDDIWVVVEGAEFADCFWPAMEQLVNTAHEFWRSSGQFSPNIIVRLASGGYIQDGISHSHSIEAALANIPGLRIVMPAFADDAAGLLRCAFRTRGITIYLEPGFLCDHASAKTQFPQPHLCVPVGRARLRREGVDLSIITYGNTVHFSLQAAERLAGQGIGCDVLDLRSILPYDHEAIATTVRKTGKVIIAHEAGRTGGFGGELAAHIAEQHFGQLDAPVRRVASLDTPVGFSRVLEDAILVGEEEIVSAGLELAHY